MTMFDGKTYRFQTVALRKFKDLEQKTGHAFECDAQGFVDRDRLHPERQELYDALLIRVASGQVMDLGLSHENRLQAEAPPKKRRRKGKDQANEVAELPRRYSPEEIKANLGPGVYLKFSDMTVWDSPDEGGPDLYIFVPELDPDEF